MPYKKHTLLVANKFLKNDLSLKKSKIKTPKDYLWEKNKVLKTYFFLLKQFGNPGPWPWFNQGKPATKQEIIIGAVLTQNTNWNNVEKAINNLRKENLNSLKKIYCLSKTNVSKLKTLLRPAGFYNLKTQRLVNLIEGILKKYKHLKNLEKEKIFFLRDFLLSINGIGKETADTILLYALNKPIFVVDNYTRKFTNHFFNQQFKQYEQYQAFFQDSLPKDSCIFKNYHALIVQWGKTNHFL